MCELCANTNANANFTWNRRTSGWMYQVFLLPASTRRCVCITQHWLQFHKENRKANIEKQKTKKHSKCVYANIIYKRSKEIYYVLCILIVFRSTIYPLVFQLNVYINYTSIIYTILYMYIYYTYIYYQGIHVLCIQVLFILT